MLKLGYMADTIHHWDKKRTKMDQSINGPKNKLRTGCQGDEMANGLRRGAQLPSTQQRPFQANRRLCILRSALITWVLMKSRSNPTWVSWHTTVGKSVTNTYQMKQTNRMTERQVVCSSQVRGGGKTRETNDGSPRCCDEART